MATTNFSNGTVVTAEWLNDVDAVVYDILDSPTTDAEAITALGITATAAELNILDGVTSTTAEINILDGVTSTAAELNILDGVTATAAELNALDGITATVTELNYTDGVTSAIQTQLDGKVDESLVDAAGDLIVGTAADTVGRLAIGTVGRVLRSDGTTAEWGSALVSGTEQASTSGTAITFSGIPSWAKRITVQFVGVSTSGTSPCLIQLGDSGGVEATGYLGAATALTNSAAVSVSNHTTGFGLGNGAATNILHGAVVLTLEDAAGFTWVASGGVAFSDGASFSSTAGSKSLSAALDRVVVTTVGGTDTFDAGAINILYE